MTDKERLYDIKHNSMWGVGYRTVTKEHFDWLIEQAERVQELEETCNINNCLDKFTSYTESQNKRYREALEEALHEVVYGYSDIAEKILKEALEESE